MPKAENDDLVAEDLSQVPRPGRVVRAARDKRGFSAQEFCELTRFSVGVLSALESDNFEALGQPVYARGYYRKCAEVLGLNRDRLVEAYEKHSGTASPVPAITQRPSIKYREGPGWFRIALMLMLLGALLGGGLWWWIGYAQIDLRGWFRAVLPEQATVAAPIESRAPAPTAAPQRPDRIRTEEPAQAAAQDAGAERPLQDAAPAPATTPGPVVVTQAGGRAAAAPTPAAAVNPQPALRIELRGGDSWTEISDSRGTVLIYKLLNQGHVQEVRGVPPYQVYLGRADLVQLWLDDRSVGFQSSIQPNLRARFKINQQGRIEG